MERRCTRFSTTTRDYEAGNEGALCLPLPLSFYPAFCPRCHLLPTRTQINYMGSVFSIHWFNQRPLRDSLELGVLKSLLEILSQAGATLPPLQAVADTLLGIIECAEVRVIAIIRYTSRNVAERAR